MYGTRIQRIEEKEGKKTEKRKKEGEGKKSRKSGADQGKGWGARLLLFFLSVSLSSLPFLSCEREKQDSEREDIREKTI